MNIVSHIRENAQVVTIMYHCTYSYARDYLPLYVNRDAALLGDVVDDLGSTAQ